MAYSPTLGRWTAQDPAGYADGLNLHAARRNNPVTRLDPTGLLSGPGPATFFDDWSPAQQKSWIDKFNKEYGKFIADSANRNCVPEELLAAIVANEVIDWGSGEQLGEGLGAGSSVGPAQITIATADSFWTANELANMQEVAKAPPTDVGVSAVVDIDAQKRGRLMDPATNIDMAGRIMAEYLKRLCTNATTGKLSNSFIRDIANGANAASLCCPKNCDEVVKMNVSASLISAMAAMWNNGPAIMQVQNIPQQSPNAHIHAQNAGALDGFFFNTE